MNWISKYSVGIIFTFLLLILTMLYVLPLTNFVWGTNFMTTNKFYFTRLVLWVVLFLVFLYNYFIEKNSFFLWKDKKYGLPFYVGAVGILYLTCLFGGGTISIILNKSTNQNLSNKLVNLTALFKNNYPLIITVCLTAGVVEELLMRGYIQPRLEKIYNNPTVGIVVSALLFGLLHLTYGTAVQVIVPFFIGLVFASFYKNYRNLKILIICHFIYDFISLMAMNFYLN
ncbi:CPBP family intramembrane glutamic endopeptidase [Chryseobacterium sp.]|uniref:CPBP family intramembrane glutamic endopeptidase n=1 Tax=Chryseobacterium sp. TaxID=1871047 RepID=UPI00389048EA